MYWNGKIKIIDLYSSNLCPFENDQIILSYNGEIYNYKFLRNKLVKLGYKFKTRSDTEVLANAWIEWKEKVFDKLDGMYAFAIWDAHHKGLFIARDPFGIKPLYYADDGTTIRIASQVKALLAGGKLGRSLEPAGHVGFFLFGYVVGHTLFAFDSP